MLMSLACFLGSLLQGILSCMATCWKMIRQGAGSSDRVPVCMAFNSIVIESEMAMDRKLLGTAQCGLKQRSEVKSGSSLAILKHWLWTRSFSPRMFMQKHMDS